MVDDPFRKPMPPARWRQVSMAGVLGFFLVGFCWHPVGTWTGPALAAWFMSTQRLWSGWLVLLATQVLDPRMGSMPWGPSQGQLLLGCLPFLLHRWTAQRKPGLLSAYALPCWGLVVWAMAKRLGWGEPSIHPASLAIALSGGALFSWGVSRAPGEPRLARGLVGFAASAVSVWALSKGGGDQLVWAGLAGGAFLALRAIMAPEARRRRSTLLGERLSWLRIPGGTRALALDDLTRPAALVGVAGERYPILRGFPIFQETKQIVGSNRTYHRLYEWIGGFYDDIQRVGCALEGTTVEQRLLHHMRLLDIPQNATVLETSVGTGLNLACLPKDARLFGLDLSLSMLERCAENLDRWGRQAVLVQGNAESLPFEENAFDVVFHVGGINFFSDRAQAIREMIRVAKPGTRLLIADETEFHAREAYDRVPIFGRLFRSRKEPVAPPIDLLPPEVEDIQLTPLRDGHFYALTFRKAL